MFHGTVAKTIDTQRRFTGIAMGKSAMLMAATTKKVLPSGQNSQSSL